MQIKSFEERGHVSFKEHYISFCKVAREVVEGARGSIVIIVEVIQCKVD
jgi:hypothetical protein